jgi:hypothetical protein
MPKISSASQRIGRSRIWMEFTVYVPSDSKVMPMVPMCGLCGNTGLINTHAHTPPGKPCGVQAYCICPNGRYLKQGNGRPKWGGSSLISAAPGCSVKK